MTSQHGPRRPGGGPPFQGGGQRPPEASFRPSDQELRAVIHDGDSQKLVKIAEELGKSMASRVTSAQIRGIFGSVRRIEMNWPRQADAAQRKAAIRQLLLLKPRLAYTAQRVPGVSSLNDVLTPAIEMVGGERERFANFLDFFEAIVAYHKAFGARNN